jgi:hypothetical protein
MPRPQMTHEQIWEVIAGLGQQEQAIYDQQQETFTKLRHAERDGDGKAEHWKLRQADLDARMARVWELRGRLRKLVAPGHRPETMPWDV